MDRCHYSNRFTRGLNELSPAKYLWQMFRELVGMSVDAGLRESRDDIDCKQCGCAFC